MQGLFTYFSLKSNDTVSFILTSFFFIFLILTFLLSLDVVVKIYVLPMFFNEEKGYFSSIQEKQNYAYIFYVCKMLFDIHLSYFCVLLKFIALILLNSLFILKFMQENCDIIQ